MDKKHFLTKIILLAIVIAGYGITASTASATAASTEQPSKGLQGSSCRNS